jgi:sugar phosphate isomerase/epimerase
MKLTRRHCLQMAAATAICANSCRFLQAASRFRFRFRYLLASSMYGTADLEEILPEVSRTGASAIDIWPKVHGNQREQIDEMGEGRFATLLDQHHVSLGCITQYKLGPFGLQDEMRLAQRLGCQTIVTGAVGPVNLTGSELKQAVARFVEQIKPHLAVAEETGVTIAIENHGRNLICQPDSLRYLAELSPPNLAIAFAPYHLPQDPQLLADLLREIVHKVAIFYAWQHGAGSTTEQPKEQELLQMPGRGALDFSAMVSQLVDADYQGWTEIFMHPFPRGIPILEPVQAVSAEINRSRDYLESLVPES